MTSARAAAIFIAAAAFAGIGYAQHYAHSGAQERLLSAARTAERGPAHSPAALALELAEELGLTERQREEVEQLEDEQQRARVPAGAIERRLRALLTQEQVSRYERLRAHAAE